MIRRPLLGLLVALSVGLLGAAAPEESAVKKATYDAQDKRDPFVPLVKDGKIVGARNEGALPEIMGIMYDPDNPIAMIGDREVTIGDMIDDYKVIEIHEASVILEDPEGARVELKQKTF